MPTDNLIKDSLSEIDEFLANSSMGVFLSDGTGILLDINEKLVELLKGRSKKEILKHYGSLFNLFRNMEFISRLTGKGHTIENSISVNNTLLTIDNEKLMVTLTAELVRRGEQIRILGIVCKVDPLSMNREIIEGLGTHLKQLFSSVKDFFYLKDTQGNILAANKVYYDLLNQSMEGNDDQENIISLLNKKDTDFITNNAFNEPSKNEFLNEKDSSSHFAVRRLGIPSSDGKLGSIVVYGHDFRQLRESQSAIIDSQTNLQSIIESAHECIWLVDPALKFVKINTNFKNFVKDFFRAEVSEGQPALDFLPKNKRSSWKKFYEEAFNGKTSRQEFALQAGGFDFYFECTASPVRTTGSSVVGVTVFLSDKTERKLAEDFIKESESRFRQLTENTSDALVLSNKEGIIYVNPAFEKLFNISHNEAYENPTIIEDAVYEADLPRYKHNRELALKKSKTGQDEQYRIKSGDQEHIVWIRSFPVYDNKGDQYRNLTVISDLTEQVELEHTISNSLLQQKAILDNIPYLAWLKDHKGRYISVNEAFAQFYEMSPGDIIGKTDKEVFTEEVAERNQRYDEEVRQAGKRRLKEDYWQRKKSRRWFETFSAPIFSDSNELIGITGISRDITDRKAMEETIIKNEEHFRSLLQYSSDAITILDKEGIIVFESSLRNRISDFSIDELIGRPFENMLHPDDIEIYRDTLNEILSEPGAQQKKEYRSLHKNKKWIYVESIFSNHLNNPSIKGIVVNTRDISDRKMAELKERVYHDNLIFLSNSALDLLGLSDRDDIYRYIADKLHTFLEDAIVVVSSYNEEDRCFRVQQISGQSKLVDLLKEILETDPLGYEFGHNHSPSDLENAGNITIYTGDSDSFIMSSLPAETSMKIIERLNINKMYNISMARNNKLLGNISIFTLNKTIIKFKHILETFVHQVSVALHRGQLEFELIKAKTKAEESDMLKTAFLANMSHEIRTPMNGILGFAEMLNDDQISESNRKKYVEIINNNGKMLMNLIDDIIDFAKIEAGQINILRQEFSLNSLLNQVHSSFLSESFKKEKTDVKLRIRKALTNEECFVQSDPNRLRQVLTNLVGNAFKFTHDGYIEFGYNLPKEGFVEFYVKDTGIGVPKEKIDVIFDRFVQADYSRSRKYSGSGLGLAISKGFVELLGGNMWAESEVNVGSTFHFNIPYIPAKKRIAEEIEKKKPKSDYNWENKVFLIAEDDKFSFKLLEGFLKKTHAEILHAEDGTKAVEICRENDKVDLILMDVQMPEMNGMEATKIIKQFRKKLPIIAQTANAIAEEKQRCFEAGFDDFVTKPINISELFNKIDQWLTSR